MLDAFVDYECLNPYFGLINLENQYFLTDFSIYDKISNISYAAGTVVTTDQLVLFRDNFVKFHCRHCQQKIVDTFIPKSTHKEWEMRSPRSSIYQRNILLQRVMFAIGGFGLERAKTTQASWFLFGRLIRAISQSENSIQ